MMMMMMMMMMIQSISYRACQPQEKAVIGSQWKWDAAKSKDT